MVDFDYQKRERAKMNAIPNECDHSAAPPKITGESADGRASKRQRKKARGAATTAEFADKESAAPAKISVQRVSFEMGGLLYETIVTAEGYFQFAVAGPSGTKIIPSLQNDGSSIEPPYDLRTLWETGLIRFPSGIGLCGSIGELLDEVKAFEPLCQRAAGMAGNNRPLHFDDLGL